jgi:hypothetical protein
MERRGKDKERGRERRVEKGYERNKERQGVISVRWSFTQSPSDDNLRLGWLQ